MDAGDGPAVSLRWNAVCLDCQDARELAEFYSTLLGWEITDDRGDWIRVANPSGGVELNIQAEDWYEPPTWPERDGTQTKMLHFEIEVEDLEAAVDHAIQAGAQHATHQPEDRDQSELRIMLDPAGHPFCLCTA